MMPKILSYIVSIMVLLAVSGVARSQETPSAKASVDKNQILIGEPVRFSIDVRSPMVSGNQLPQFDSIPHFEIIEKANRDSLISAAGVSYHLEWKLTSFDSGTRYIPALSLTVGNHVYKTDSLAVEVSYGKVDTAQDYHDIKTIIDQANPDVKYIPWILVVITALALFAFIWFIRHPFKKEELPEERAPGGSTVFDEAMASLDQLRKMLREDPAAVKKYYSGLNDTLRVYMNRRLGMVTMEKTSEEIILAMSNLKMERDRFSELTNTLRMGDFVKFAKYVPGPNENETNLEVIRSTIGYIHSNY